LEILSRPLSRLWEKYEFEFKVVSNFPPGPNFLNGLNIVWHRWQAKKELEELQSLDIGVMPLFDNQFTRGKCGFKALLCMACGIPVVVSPVGGNSEIITDGINGFLAATEDEWVGKLSRLIEDGDLRKKMGMRGRETVEEKYSIRMNIPKVIEALRKAKDINHERHLRHI
ncbi:glycosyltransferase family 4 protein, partial [bacterium]|nr:glycosyltransferase family 4 protein [bacterium]